MPDKEERLNTRGLDTDRLARWAWDDLSHRVGGVGTDADISSYTRASGWATLALLAEVQKLRIAVENLNQRLP
jgi:hypothetical protein